MAQRIPTVHPWDTRLWEYEGIIPGKSVMGRWILIRIRPGLGHRISITRALSMRSMRWQGRNISNGYDAEE